MKCEIVFDFHPSLALMARLLFASVFCGQHWPPNAPGLLPAVLPWGHQSFLVPDRPEISGIRHILRTLHQPMKLHSHNGKTDLQRENCNRVGGACLLG